MRPPKRTEQAFPTRQYRHPYATAVAFGAETAFEPGRSYRFITGRDVVPVPIGAGDPDAPHDLFATAVLFGADLPPLSLRALQGRLKTELPVERSFVVGDGGQIPWTPDTDDLERSFRLIVTRHRSAAVEPELLVSASTDIDSETNFLQVICWDAAAGAYQFYDRRDRIWFWAGSSWDALAPDARGKGPFDSHVNGALNMKELKAPWVHWHSQASAIRDEVLAPTDPLRDEPLWKGKSQAEVFERSIARPGIQRWTASRVERCTWDGRLTRLPEFMRQVLETTTVNLAASPVSSARLATADAVRLPLTFFLHADALIETIELEPTVELPPVRADVYREMLRRYDVHLADDGRHRIPGDTHFLFVVPEPAFEDLAILQALRDRGVLSDRLAAALLMVDFCNAVYSRRRASLMRYVPEDAALEDPAGLEAEIIACVEASPTAGDQSSPEAELLANWRIGDGWRAAYEERIDMFLAAVVARFDAANAFAPVFELADSRRREFRTSKLAEFDLTTPRSILPDLPLLEFTPDGDVRAKP
jgi:hypothetical protein